MPCVFVIPSPYPPKISLRVPLYPPAGNALSVRKLFRDDPGIKAGKFQTGHLHWDDVLFHEAQAMRGCRSVARITQRRNPVCDAAEPLGFLSFSRSSLRRLAYLR